MADGWQSVRLDEIEPIAVAGGFLWRPLRRTLGIEAFFYFYAERFRYTEDWDGGVAYLEQGLAEYPDHPGMLYSLACYEALAGRRETALAHLQDAIEIDPSITRYAQGDSDLDSIRTMPGFPGPPDTSGA